MPKKLYLVVALQLLFVPLAAQVAPSGQQAHEAGINYWIGGALSIFNPDYGCSGESVFSCSHNLVGVGPYFDTNFFIHGRIGLEGQARLMLFHGPDTLVENSFMGGPRVLLLRHRDLHISGKFLLGVGQVDVPAPLIGGGTYFAYAPGGAVDFPVSRHLSARVEYEYQFWPGYKCFQCSNGSSGGLTPNGLSFGVSYAIPTSHPGTAPN